MSTPGGYWAYPWPDGPPGGGRCPVCGQLIGVPAPAPAPGGRRRSPSLLLEVSGPKSRPGWRLTVWGGPESVVSRDRPFDHDEVVWRYALCGAGHYFLCWARTVAEDGQQSWRDQNYVAAVGPTASGKSYLLIRTLNQPLTAIAVHPGDEGDFVQPVRRLDLLEGEPRRVLEGAYHQTKNATHLRMGATRSSDLMPGPILLTHLHDADIPTHAAALQSAVTGRMIDPLDWGQSFRQPLIVRSRFRDREALTCVADLAGELFGEESTTVGLVGVENLGLLRHCNALLWTVDPFHSHERFPEYLRLALGNEALFERMAKGSSRADSLGEDYEEMLKRRSTEHDHLAERLADDTEMVGNVAGTLRQLVAVTKSDLIERALHTRPLTALSPHDTGPGAEPLVTAGVTRYLLYFTGRADLEPTPPARQLLDYLAGGGVRDEAAALSRRRQVAAALVRVYSDPGAFWNLVQHGRPVTVLADTDRDTGTDRARCRPVRIDVPGIAEHLRDYLRPGGTELLHLRDLVLSALGCGVLYGLGNAYPLERMLRQRWRLLQFFLCSPLGTVPLIGQDETRIEPSQGAYPSLSTPSAALIQLNLAIMRGALR
jgi:hypothetical protein